MILDSTTLFSDGQAITASAPSTNTVDLGPGRDIGPGVPVPLLCQVVEDFDNLTSLTVEIQTSDTEDFANADTLVRSTRLAGDLKRGNRFPIAVIPDGTRRYLRLNYVIAGTAPSKGRITAGIVWGVQSNR